jgi:cysteine synthase
MVKSASLDPYSVGASTLPWELQANATASQPFQNTPSQPSQLFQDATACLGMVPIVRLNQIHPHCQFHDLYLKLESCNPGGSIKEKNAAYLVANAEQQGLLTAGGTIVESSSGNFGIGLAIVGAVRGYRVVIVIDAKTSQTIRRMLTAYGAELMEVPLAAADEKGSMQVARMQMAQDIADRTPGAWYPCQHLNPENTQAHALFTGPEIAASFPEPPDGIVIGISTAGQLGGISEYFQQHYPQTKIIGVDVAGSAIFGMPRHPYKMTGLGLSFVPPNFNAQNLAAAYAVEDGLAFSVCHALARREGLLLGASTGAIVAAALSYLDGQTKPQRLLLLNPDRGDRYIETMYNADWLREQNIRLSSDTELITDIAALQSVPLNILHRSNPI